MSQNNFIALLLKIIILASITPSCKSVSGINKESNKNQIDQLNSKEQIIEFVTQRFDQLKPFSDVSFNIKPLKELYQEKEFHVLIDSFNLTSSWYFDDLNKDGLTDILILGVRSGIRPILILGSNDDSYKLLNLERGYRTGAPFPVIEKIGDKSFVRNYELVITFNAQGEKVRFLKNYLLTIKNDYLIEHPINKEKLQIEKITIHQSRSNHYPHIVISVDNKKEVKFIEMTAGKATGLYRKTLSEPQFTELWNWLSYIHIGSLNKYYQDDLIDGSEVDLNILFNDNQTKEINDSGRSGTFGLIELYRKINQIYNHGGFELIKAFPRNELRNQLKLFYEK